MKNISLYIIMTLILIGCNNNVSDNTGGADSGSSQEIVTSNQGSDNNEQEAPVDNAPDSSASIPTGPTDIKLRSNKCLDPDLDLVHKKTRLMLCNGSLANGKFDPDLIVNNDDEEEDTEEDSDVNSNSFPGLTSITSAT
jgi:hypothetical protein